MDSEASAYDTVNKIEKKIYKLLELEFQRSLSKKKTIDAFAIDGKFNRENAIFKTFSSSCLEFGFLWTRVVKRTQWAMPTTREVLLGLEMWLGDQLES